MLPSDPSFIPPRTLEALHNYRDKGLFPGGTLTAMIEGEAWKFVGALDPDHKAAMFHIMGYIANQLGAPWGRVGCVAEHCQEVRSEPV